MKTLYYTKKGDNDSVSYAEVDWLLPVKEIASSIGKKPFAVRMYGLRHGFIDIPTKRAKALAARRFGKDSFAERPKPSGDYEVGFYQADCRFVCGHGKTWFLALDSAIIVNRESEHFIYLFEPLVS